MTKGAFAPKKEDPSRRRSHRSGIQKTPKQSLANWDPENTEVTFLKRDPKGPEFLVIGYCYVEYAEILKIQSVVVIMPCWLSAWSRITEPEPGRPRPHLHWMVLAKML
jgi:hypothetical protein